MYVECSPTQKIFIDNDYARITNSVRTVDFGGSQVPAAVKACQRAGVTVRMVTGDNLITAVNIAKAAGIYTEDGLVSPERPRWAACACVHASYIKRYTVCACVRPRTHTHSPYA
jgi:hypothetical protein